ncbi:MAG: hypothetical protein LBK27_02775 [Treponema sp.]|jgi:hypothetical protein|nr:hypothetical protein [Treponema sp.]
MRAFILSIVICILPAGIAWAQNFPVSGSWTLQAIGTAEEFFIEIEGTTWTFEMGGSTIPQTVTIDNKKKTVVIPLLAGLADYYFFEVKNGYIDLKAGGKFNIPLLDSIRSGMTGMEGLNDITDEFVEKIIVEIEAAFYRVPIMRLYRN